MALRNRNPQDPRRSESPTKRIVSKFMGMITGEPDSKVSSNYATLIENMIDRGEYSTVRSGSKLYSSTAIGFLCTANASTNVITLTSEPGIGCQLRTGDIAYFKGDDLPSPLAEDTAYYLNRSVAVSGSLTYFGSSDVDTTNDTLSLSGSGLVSGNCVRFGTGFGALPGGLVTGYDYYVTSLGGGLYKVSDSLDDYLDGVYVDLTTTGGAANSVWKIANTYTLHPDITSAYNNGPNTVDILDAGSGNIWMTYGTLNAKCDHVKSGKVILFFGKSVYVTDKSMLIIEKVFNINEDDPDEVSAITVFGDDAVLFSNVGIFKIFLNQSFYYMCKINLPSSNVLITDDAATVTKVYGYLYFYSLARITGSGNRDRTSDGVVLQIETATNLKEGSEKDYGEVYFENEVGDNLAQNHILGYIQVPNGYGWGLTHAPLYRTKDIGAGGSSSGLTGVGNRRDQPVWVADVPLCKAVIIDTTTPGQLTIVGASTNKFVYGDVGSRITICKGATVVDATITGYTSADVVTITGAGVPSSATAVGVIGGYRGGTASQAVVNGENVITIGSDNIGNLYYDDKAKIVFVSDGTIRHVDHVIYDTVYKLVVKETGDFTSLAIGLDGGTGVVCYQRKWNDTVPDSPQADGRVSLQDRIDYGTDLYIPRRMFRPMPDGDTGIIDNGFMVVAERDQGEYNYCQTGDKPYCIGQYKYPEQNRKVTGSISHITGYPFMALVTMYDRTGIITLSSSQNIGRTEIGENIFQLPELSVVDDKHGVIAWKTLTYKNSNLIFGLTSDSAFRYFSGTAWSREDFGFVNGSDAVSKQYLRKIEHLNIKAAVYSMNGGIKIWFQMLVSGVLTDMCLRFSTEPGEGYGWSLITGDDWVFPIDEVGVFSILDDNDIERVLVIDKNDYRIYEIDTFDRSTTGVLPALDKEDVEDTEIAWKRRGIEHIAAIGSEQKRLLHEMSYVNIEPVDKANRGATGYTATGQRDAQELTLKTFFDGERTDESARAEDFPENGEVVFSGRRRDANKILMELSGTAGELNLTGVTDIFLIEERAPTRARRVMTEHAIALALLAGKAVHICRSETIFNRVTGVDLGGGTVTKTDGPDGKTDSGFIFTSDVTCDNAALTAYTIVLWSKDANLFTGIAGWTTYGAAVNTWQMYYKTGANLAAAVVMQAGTKFDMRIYSKVLTAAQLALLREDTVDFEGKMLLPGFIGD